jgi:endonuclease YncB( thermonuclease family)
MDELHKKLELLQLEDIPEYSLANNNYIGKIVDIYDGDTCKIILLKDNGFIRFNCRLINVDTPEMKLSKNGDIENHLAMKNKAFAARNRLIQLATNIHIVLENQDSRIKITKLLRDNTKLVMVKCHEFDKYGRLLVELFDIPLFDKGGVSYNQVLITEKFANSYDGGTKSCFKFEN